MASFSADRTGPSSLADDNPAPGETTISSSDGSAGKESACNAEDMGDADLIPEWGKSPGRGHGNPLQYSCLGNPMDGGAWWASLWGRRVRLTERLSTTA